jgi:hypothetical protein
MNIREIALQLNEISKSDNFNFSKIQTYRNNYYGKQPHSWLPFSGKGIKDDEDYAYHSGGRKEIQFNIGHDSSIGTGVFRYGVAFSLSRDITIRHPIAHFRPLINRFNQFLIGNPNYFESFEMWYYSTAKFEEHFNSVRSIDENIIQSADFIFIGKYIEKEVEDINGDDILEILRTFDYLMPLYKQVQLAEIEIEKRIARICWNDNGWIMPSGELGKSKDENTHEGKHGYGHEEWLCDISKIIDGYHYGFLEPIRQHQDAYANNAFNVWLYSIDGETKNRYWIGDINNLIVLNREEAEGAKTQYIKRGWMSEMERQIIASGVKAKGFSSWKGVDLFNIKFIPINLRVNDPYFQIPEGHPIAGQTRYNFSNFKDEFALKKPDLEDEFDSSFLGDREEDDDEYDVAPEKKTYIREPKAIEIIDLHNRISKALTKELKKLYGYNKVKREYSAGYGGNKIDIVVMKSDGLIFYEIKTYTSLKTCIREAIGQLMEYSLWTHQKKAKQLIVVSQPVDDFDNARIYFRHLRDTYNLPLYYQSFDIEKNLLSEIV